MTSNVLQLLLKTMSVEVHVFALCEVEPGWRLAKRGTEEALLVHYVLEGSGTVQVGDGPPAPFAPHSILIPPRGMPHTVGYPDATRTALIEESQRVLPNGIIKVTAGSGNPGIVLACGAITARYAGALGLLDRLHDVVVEDLSANAHLRHAFSFMIEELATPSLGTPEVTAALMKQCLLVFLRTHLGKQGVDSPIFSALREPRLAKAVAAMVDAPAAAHTVESLAHSCGMSRTAFSESFSSTFGEGPIAFLQRTRLRLAARLLTTSPIPVKIVASSVGYASRSYFSHAFKAAYGEGPTTFRKRWAESDRRADPVDGWHSGQGRNGG